MAEPKSQRKIKTRPPLKKAPSKTAGAIARGRAKKVSNAASTGNAGGSFENRVQAAKLLSLGLGSATSGVPSSSRVVELRFQARVHGVHTDDLVCTVEDVAGRRSRVLMQMKRGLTAQKSDLAFEEAVGNAWLDYSKKEFVRNRDKLIIAYDAGSAHSMRGAREVCGSSRTSLSASEWIQKLTEVGASNVLKRNALGSIRAKVELYKKAAVSEDEFFEFAKHLEFISHDLDEEGTHEHLNYLNQISEAARRLNYDAKPSDVWARMVTACMNLNAESGGVNFQNLAHVLGGDLDVFFSAARQSPQSQPSLSGLASALDQANGQSLSSHNWAASTTTIPGHVGAAQNEQLPAARSSSVNKLISRQLDHINEQLKGNRYVTALAGLKQLGSDMADFDAHQKARWYHMRGICSWHQGDNTSAADDFVKAAELCSDDDKLAAAKVRGLLLREDVEAAVQVGVVAQERFPESLAVWLAVTNAKLRKNETIELSDIPAQHRTEADAVHLVAWGLYEQGRAAEARQIIRDALKLHSANFYTRNTAISFWLEYLAKNRLNFSLMRLADDDAAAIREIVSSFEPRHEKLWHFEVPGTAYEAAKRLAVAYFFLGEPSESLTVVDEIKARNGADGDTLKVEMEALSQLGRRDEAIDRGKSQLTSLSIDGLITLAHLAASACDFTLLEQVVEQARVAYPADHSSLDVLAAMRWDALLRANEERILCAELDAYPLLSTQSVPLLVIAARALANYRGQDAAAPIIIRAQELTDERADVADRYMVATLLMGFQRYDDAARVYESIITKGEHSDLHKDLLFCYLRTDDRRKAIDLIQSFPAGWETDTATRHLALELGHAAGDWDFLQRLTQVQLSAEPNIALSWLLKLMVDARRVKSGSSTLEIPDILEGTIQELTQIAAAELAHGQPLKAMQRLYRTRRLNMGSTESAASHVAAHLSASQSLELLDMIPETVSAGTSVQIADEKANLRTITVDPKEVENLPDTDEFHDEASPDVQQIIGLKVGECFDVKDNFGGAQTYTIVGIQSAYRRLLDLAHKALTVSLQPSSLLTVVSLHEDDDGQTNFEPLTQQLQSTADRANEVLALYDSNHFTLGVTARMLGRDIVTLVRDWPSHKFQMHVGGGSEAERNAATELLESSERNYVIDAATLVELAMIERLDTLKHLSRVYVSSNTSDILHGQLALAEIDRSSGVASAEDGKLVYQEITPEQRKLRAEMLSNLCSAIERDCVIVPAYGPASVPEELAHVKQVISPEEYDVLLVALEHGATLFALDARFRAMAVYAGMETIWPQVVLLYQHSKGLLSLRDYARACANMFLRNRDFIVLRSQDLLMLVRQGSDWLNFGLQHFVKHISKPSTEFSSAANVTLGFLSSLVLSGPCQFGAFVELVERLLEGLFRHKHCPDDFETRATNFLTHSQNVGQWHFDIEPFVQLAIRKSKAAAMQPVRDKPIRARVAFCTRTPVLLSGSVAQAAAINLESGALQGEQQSSDAVGVTLTEAEGTSASSQQNALTPDDLSHP